MLKTLIYKEKTRHCAGFFWTRAFQYGNKYAFQFKGIIMTDQPGNNPPSKNPEARPEARIVQKDRVFDGFFKMDELTIEQDTHDGGSMTVKRLIFERGHAVAILGYDPARDEVLLVN